MRQDKWSESLRCSALFGNAATVLVLGIAIALSPFALHANTEEEKKNESVDGVARMKEFSTPAGHKFWYYPMPDADRTALVVDWTQEVPLGKGTHPAAAELGIDVMLRGGAGGRSAADIVADFEDLDAGSDLWARPRGVTGLIVAPDKYLAKAREIAHLVLTEPAFKQRWFDREHKLMLDSATDEKSQSWGMIWSLARKVFTGDHPYNKFWSFNALDEFEALTLEDIQAWHKASFSTKTSTIAVAGSAGVETIGKEIDLLFANMPENEATKPIALPRPEAPGKTILLHVPDAPKSILVFAGNFPPNSQTLNTPLQLGIGVLGYGKNSRLFKTVRSGMGASYGFGADVFEVTSEHRMFAMSGEIETAKLQDALTEIEQAYTDFRNSGINRIEFQVAKRFYNRKLKKDLQNPVNVAFALNSGIQNGFTADYMQNSFKRVAALDRKSVNSLITESFPEYESMLKLVLSPDDKAVEGACVISKIEDAQKCL